MEQLAIIILLLCLLLNAVALYFMNRTLHGMAEDMAFLKLWIRRIYLQTSFPYLKSLTEVRDIAVKGENYEFAKKLDELIKKAQEEMAEILR